MPDSPIAWPAPARNVCILRYGSLAILGGYAVATCYKMGLVSRILPSKWNSSLESTVEAIKERTHPMGDAKRFALVRSHLTRTYSLAASGMLAIAAGVATFWVVPSIPFAIPISTTLVATLLLVGVPKAYMQPTARLLCFYLSLYFTGYAFGPIGWVAQDTLVVFVLLSGCTMTGLCVPLYLTRGMVSYVLSAQLLSSALSIALITAPKRSSGTSAFKKLRDQEGVQILLNGDINVLFTMQILSNVGICALHTLPNIYRFVSWQGGEEELIASVDPLKEAFAICAGTMYAVYRTVSWSCRLLIRRVMSDNQQHPKGDAGQNTWLAMAHHSFDANRASGVVSGLVMGLWYVRAVSLLQKGDMETTLNQLRSVCTHISPMKFLLGSNAVRR
ncbi:hypothetical protein ABL78_1014 [Leptomonas seymouri]|uniref:Uncharacterized protein n=1 Tax=Leptomonas seymouri TaxID=5684 RepID=A0A0N1I2S4_LEPSE|nr:hypothetical protein ABL78_1014 [Leptomonas seymouri]|eukprot:KPI89845.1 hypothetical protein ABL78_1014 [Leptomonas seymouri]